ncbi:MAG TPA: hypothetical protein VFZ61_20415 [Polyangiales bacterium]
MRLEWILGTVLALALAGCPEENPSEEGEGGEQDAGGNTGGGADAGASADAGGRDAGGQTEDAGGGGNTGEKVGTFTIELKAPVPASGGSAATEGYSSISGKVFDRPVPAEVIWEQDMSQGGCVLVKPRVPFCEKPCGTGVCVEDDKCAPNAEPQVVGTVTITGLKQTGGSTADIKIDPVGNDNPASRVYSTPGDVSLPYPPFAEGADVKLQAPGGSLGAFSMTAKGIAPLEVTTTAFPLKTGMSLPLAWKTPGQGAASRVFVEVDISHHGGTKGKIQCDVADTGSLELAAPLITRLLGLGVAGFPTITLTRVSKASGQTSAGPVELQIIEEVGRAVQIDGLVSCSGPSDCPSGKTCQADLTCK